MSHCLKINKRIFCLCTSNVNTHWSGICHLIPFWLCVVANMISYGQNRVWSSHRDTWRYDHPVKFEVFYKFSLSLSRSCSLSLFKMIYYGLLCRHDCRQFLSSILCKAGAVVMEVVFLSGSLQRYRFAMSARQQIQLLQGCLHGRDVWGRNEGLFLHFDCFITSSTEQNIALHLTNTVIQYNTEVSLKLCARKFCVSALFHTQTNTVLYINIDKKEHNQESN